MRPLLCPTWTEQRPLPLLLGDGAATAAGFPRGRNHGHCRLPLGAEPWPLPASLGGGAAAAAASLEPQPPPALDDTGDVDGGIGRYQGVIGGNEQSR